MTILIIAHDDMSYAYRLTRSDHFSSFVHQLPNRVPARLVSDNHIVWCRGAALESMVTRYMRIRGNRRIVVAIPANLLQAYWRSEVLANVTTVVLE